MATVLSQIKEAIEGQSEAFEEFKSAYDRRFDELQERVEHVEARRTSPGLTVGREDDEGVRLFEKWLRNPRDHTANQELENYQRTEVVIMTPSAGGYAVPEQIMRDVERLEKKFSPVRNLVRVVQTQTTDFKALVNMRGATAGWLGESTPRTATATPLLRERVPTSGEIYSYPKCSNWSLDDIFFDVRAWLAEEVAQEFAVAEGEAVIRGDGIDKPTGMLDTAPDNTPDFASPLRDARHLSVHPMRPQPHRDRC